MTAGRQIAGEKSTVLTTEIR